MRLFFIMGPESPYSPFSFDPSIPKWEDNIPRPTLEIPLLLRYSSTFETDFDASDSRISEKKSRKIGDSRYSRELQVATAIEHLSCGGLNSVTIRQLEDKTLIPRATIQKTTVWKVYVNHRKSSHVSEIHIRPLTTKMLMCMQGKEEDPADIAANNELALLIKKQQKDYENDENKHFSRSGNRN